MPDLGIVGDLARIIVGLVLVVAALAKWRDGFQWIKQAADMGVDHRIATLVPWIEFVVGGLLIIGLLLPFTAIAAGLLLLAFTAIIVLRIADGSRPPCACFGVRSERPLGARDIARNVILVVLAVLALGS